MTKLISLFRIAAFALPAIMEIAQAIERALPQAGQGAQKIALFRELIGAVYETAGDGSVSLDEFIKLAEKLVNLSVRFFNSTGVFKSSEG